MKRAIVMNNRRAFTLVELLACLAVTAILAAILFMLVRSGIDKAQRSASLSNLRQIVAQTKLYSAEHGGYGPPYESTEWGGGKLQTGYQYIFEFLPREYGDGEWGIWIRPGDSAKETAHDAGGLAWSYARNISLPRRGARVDGVYQEGMLEHPADTMIFIETTANAGLSYAPAHFKMIAFNDSSPSGTAAVAFADGHVGVASRGQITDEGSSSVEDLAYRRTFWYGYPDATKVRTY